MSSDERGSGSGVGVEASIRTCRETRVGCGEAEAVGWDPGAVEDWGCVDVVNW